LPAQLLDPGHHLGGGGGGLAARDAGTVEQAGLAVTTPAVDPLGCALAGDAGLGGDVGDRSGLAARDEPEAARDRQRGMTVVRGRVFLRGGRVGLASRPAAERPVPRLRPWPASPTS
jgi:hypothetical protein